MIFLFQYIYFIVVLFVHFTFVICHNINQFLIFIFCADVLCASKYIVDYTRNQNTKFYK